MVEGDAVTTVGEGGEDVGVQGAGGGEGVALDAGDLHQAADGVADHAQVVLQAHLGRVFYLVGTAAEELAGCGGSHGAGDSHLTVATYFGAGDGGVPRF